MSDDPDAIYFGGMDAEGALLVQQLRAAGYEGVFFGPDGIKSKPTFVESVLSGSNILITQPVDKESGGGVQGQLPLFKTKRSDPPPSSIPSVIKFHVPAAPFKVEYSS